MQKGDLNMANAIQPPERSPKPKQERFLRRFYIDTRIDTSSATQPIFYLLGEDNDDLSVAISWDTTSTKNVLGNRTTSSTISEETLTNDPFYARDEGDPMSLLLQHLHATDAQLDRIKRNFYMAKVDNTGETIYAYRQVGDVKLTSVGGPADNADNMPFEVTLSGAKVDMDYDFETEIFTDKP